MVHTTKMNTKQQNKLRRIRSKEKKRINGIKSAVNILNDCGESEKKYVDPMLKIFTFLENICESRKLMMSMIIYKDKKIPQSVKDKMLTRMEEIKNDYNTFTSADNFPESFKNEVGPELEKLFKDAECLMSLDKLPELSTKEVDALTKSNHIEKYQKEYHFDDKTDRMVVLNIMFSNIDKLANELDIDRKYIELLKKFEPVIIIFEQFTRDIIENKNTIFPNQKIKEEIRRVACFAGAQ